MPRDIVKHRATCKAYYYKNKPKWKIYERRKRKNKGQKEFREKRNKCIWYLIKVRKWTYRDVAKKLSICDPKNVWKMLKTYERNRNEKAHQL
jgi:hypothetical protein